MNKPTERMPSFPDRYTRRRTSLLTRGIESVFLILSVLLSACSAGLSPPAGTGFVPAPDRPFSCRENFRVCAVRLLNDFMEKVEESRTEAIPFSPNCRFTQNTEQLAIGDGFFRETARFSAPRIYVDVAGGEAALYSILVLTNQNFVHFTGRFSFAQPTAGAYLISELEVITALASSAAGCYPETPSVVPTGETGAMTRQQLIALADSYFDGIEQTSSQGIPFHAEVRRTENCLTMAYGRWMQRLQMNTLFATIPRVRERHIIADPSQGVAIANIVFDHAIGPVEIVSTPMSERFQIKDGQIRFIEAVFFTTPYGTESGWERKNETTGAGG